MQIRFVTKAGHEPAGPARRYEHLRHDALNANTWFRNRDLPPDPETGKAPKAKLRQLPRRASRRAGRSCKNKAFFFFNYEEQRRRARARCSASS